jgi:hypothetical protein
MNVRKAAVLIVVLIAALALVPLVPFAVFGYAGQDFEFHVTSWLALRDAWLAGHFAPMWDARANFGLGDAHLSLYPVGSTYVGGLVALFVPLRLAPAVFVWMAITLSGLAMFAASREFLAQRDRLIAAALYMFSPYLLTSALVRFAAGELLVQAALPLILLQFYRLLWPAPNRSARPMLLLALLLGASWFTNVPESVVLLYCLLLAAAVVSARQRSLAPLARFLLAEALAAALAAFYLAPLWFERPFINASGLTRLDPHLLLIFASPLPGVERLKIFKWSCWLFAIAIALFLLASLRKRRQTLLRDRPSLLWLSLAAMAFLFQLPIASLAWSYAPQMGLISFPFRFLPLMGAALPLVLLAPATNPHWRKPVYAGVALLSLIPVLEHIRTQVHPDTRLPPIRTLARQWQTNGYGGLPEFTPSGVLSRASSSHPLSTFEPYTATPGCRIDAPRRSTSNLEFSSSSQTMCRVQLPVFFYPYWRASAQTGALLTTEKAPGGTLLVDVPAGFEQVTAAFVARSRIRTGSAVLSVATLLLLLLVLVAVRPQKSLPSVNTSFRSPFDPIAGASVITPSGVSATMPK